MPSTGGYLVSPLRIAAIAASLTLSGVSKSGSPTESEITSRPLALRSRAFCVTAMVAEGLTRERTSAMKAMAGFLDLAFSGKRRTIVSSARGCNPDGDAARPISPPRGRICAVGGVELDGESEDDLSNPG